MSKKDPPQQNDNIMVAEAVTEDSTTPTCDYEKRLRMKYVEFMVQLDENLVMLGHIANSNKTRSYGDVVRITLKYPPAFTDNDKLRLKCYLNSEKAFKLVYANMHRAKASWKDFTHYLNHLHELTIEISCRYPENDCMNSCVIT